MTIGKNEWHVYVLELEDGFWYVGIAICVEKRFKQHCGTKWGRKSIATRAHKPIRIVETQPLGVFDDAEANQLEKNKAIEYAIKYGHDRVSGGGYHAGDKGFLRDVKRFQEGIWP